MPLSILGRLAADYPSLAPLRGSVEAAFNAICDTYRRGGKLLCCGNGGSAADSDHIVGELLKSFILKRPIDPALHSALTALGEDGAFIAANLEGALPAISLTAHTALISAYANDREPALVYAQQVAGLGRPGDALIALSTSGNSKNCVYAALTAKAAGITVIAMTGSGGGKLARIADILINVPENETYRVQELHLPVYHCLCAMLEAEFFGKTRM